MTEQVISNCVWYVKLGYPIKRTGHYLWRDGEGKDGGGRGWGGQEYFRVVRVGPYFVYDF